MQSMSSGGVSGEKNSVLPNFRLALVQLKSFKLGKAEITARHATHQEFTDFAQSLITVTGNVEKWTVEERRDFLNWCIENDVLEVKEDRLVPSIEAVDTSACEPAAPVKKKEELAKESEML